MFLFGEFFPEPEIHEQIPPRIEVFDGYFHTGRLVVMIVGGDHQLDFFQ